MPTSPKNPMTADAAARVQSATAKQGGDTGKGSWPATAQSKAAENANKSAAAGAGGNNNNNNASGNGGQGQAQGGAQAGK